jgi:hypothetical protein
MVRSVLSNPVESGINAFESITGMFQRGEQLKMRRELLDREKAESDLRMESNRVELENRKQLYATNSKMASMLDEPGAAEALSGFVSESGKEKPKYSESQINAGIDMASTLPHFKLDKLDEQADATKTFLDHGDAILQQVLVSPQQKITLTREQDPAFFDSFKFLYKDGVGGYNKGTDRHGLSVEKDGVNKEVKAALIDKTTNPPTVSFIMDVETPVKEGQVYKPNAEGPPKYTVAPNAKGMMETGNIDLTSRPIRRNGDGSVSTVRSISIDEGSGTVLIPTINDDGKLLSNKEAVEEYKKTGKHLGIFDSREDADAYAEQLHLEQADYAKQFEAKGQASTKYDAPKTHGNGPDPTEDIVKVPIPLLQAQVQATQDWTTRFLKLRAQASTQKGDFSWMDKIEERKRVRRENEAVSQAFSKVDTSKGVDEQRRQFITEFTKLMPDARSKETIELAKTIIADKERETEHQKRTLDETIRHNKATESKVTADKGQIKEDADNNLIVVKDGKATPVTDATGKPVKGKAATDPDTLKILEDGSIVAIEKGTHKVTPIMQNGKPVKARHELSVSELHNLEIKSKEVRAIAGDDTDVEEGSAQYQKATFRADELMQTDPKLTANQAWQKAKADIGVKKVLKPMTKKVVDEIMKSAKTPAERKQMAIDKGYDPETEPK